MKKVVERESNKGYYRVLHVPIWIWVFFILPGNLTSDLYAHGPDRRHWIWLAIVTAICAWRGLVGRLPGGEPKPYITHYGVDQPNLPYRVVCYTAAWIDLLVPFALNGIGLTVAVQVQSPHPDSALYRRLEDPRGYRLAFPGHLSRKPDVHRNDLHGSHSSVARPPEAFAGRSWVGAPTRVDAEVGGLRPGAPDRPLDTAYWAV